MSSNNKEGENKNNNDNNIRDKVRDALRGQKVKLWTPPYVNDTSGDSEPIVSALEHLAKSWKTNRILKLDDNDIPTVVKALQEWQLHALTKLKAKQSSNKSSTNPTTITSSAATPINLEIKILGWKGEPLTVAATIEGQGGNDFSQSVEIDNSKNTPIQLLLKGVSTLKTDVQLLEFLHQKFFPTETTNLRLIHRGKNISATSDNDGETLAHLFQTSLQQQTNTIPLMCLVSHVDPAEQQRATSHSNLQARIAAIRDAARQIRDSTKLEITDQHGKIVAMTKQDRLGFLTALALHRLGLNAPTTEESLVLLLEADVEWNDHPNLNFWKDRVDNYGLLQLDIAWIYLQLESLSNLPDSLKRLEEAERVLRKQVHKNFVALATAQAEMGNAKEVPPLAAVFAKLFLLQGIAYLCDCNENQNPTRAQKSQQCLDQAFVLLQCLRSMTPEESVQQLLEVMGSSSSTAAVAAAAGRRQFTTSDAIAALRKSQGDMDAAAMVLAEAETKRRQRQQDREVQHQHGLCQNETDPVDLINLATLKPLLQGDGNSSGGAAAAAGGTNDIMETANTDLAVGLLRLADNDLTRALELYAEQGYDAHKIHALVDALDEKLVRRGLLGRAILKKKKKKRKLYDTSGSSSTGASQQRGQALPPVDEMALVTLMSMGVEDSKAKTALQNTGNDVEQAMVWLSTVGTIDEEVEEKKDDSGTNNEVAMEEADATGSGGEAKRKDDTTAGTEEDGGGDSSSSMSAEEEEEHEQRDNMEWEAQELLHRELGDILEERDLEKEYLGKSLNEEWKLVQKYRQSH